MDWLFLLLLTINIISGLILIPYPINLFLLAISSNNWKDPVISEYYEKSKLPNVTIQLPVFNETNVIRRTLSGITKLVYPSEKLFIQILDDSTDQTSLIIDSIIDSLEEKGFNVEIIRRKNRKGYKAGALENGIESGVSEFVAIFDADFQVNPHFLEKTIHYFKSNEHVGAVQTRWEHNNLRYSIFTRAMSIGLDGHFLVEKMGRKRRNAAISFNGTGGIWRSSVIKESSGWSSETLAEDLDLAYRSQMRGYDILYLKDITNSQEIPPTIRCWIIQQSRWAKGFSQNLRKNFIQFWMDSRGKSRIQGSIHLTQYFVPLMILLNTSSGSLLLYFSQFKGEFLFVFGLLFTLAAFLGILAYVIAVVRAKRPLWHILLIPLFLFWGAGLIVRMGLGSLSGLLHKGGEFVRTPKFNLIDDQKIISASIRENIPLDRIILVELAYIVIICFGLLKSLELGGTYLSQALYYIFLLLSTLNLVFSELLHAYSSY
ncbi:MAG: glycosyltransferase [Candidatus Hodarchaeota archaeon]